VLCRANCSVNGMTGTRARMVSPMTRPTPGAPQVFSHLSVPAPAAKPSTAATANSTSWQALRIFGGQAGLASAMAMIAHTTATSPATPMSPDGSRRASREKATRGRKERASDSGFMP
jgi:hypothetical protein